MTTAGPQSAVEPGGAAAGCDEQPDPAGVTAEGTDVSSGRERGGPGRRRPRRSRPRRSPLPRNRWSPPLGPRGTLTAGLSVLLALLLLGHRWIPNTPGHLGSLVDTLLPWTGLAIPALWATALLRRSPAATVAVLLPTVVWAALFGGTRVPRSSPGGHLTVVTHNVNQANPDPRGTARSLIAARADLVALEELSPATAPTYERALAAAYPYHFYQGTVGLWSTSPLRDAHAVPIMPWTRAVRATVETPEGPLAVYVVHLPSVRVTPAGFTTGARDAALDRLTAVLRAERARSVVVMGDFNGSADDRALRPLTSRMSSAQSTAGRGFGFSWPARFPVTRIDQIFVQGVRTTSAWTLPATASDHLPVAARLDLDPAGDGKH